REKAVGIGANVIMPNLSPPEQREKYMIYDNKMFTGVEASESIALLEKQLNSIGYRISVSRGDFKKDT
ncbi:MAG TPA: [FeFe] hydrogenase H-cluster radical SAM maturase HydE, partial [Bacteroidetes bacterium]|nr:[FeFe] hydrogenase H-cluster radical SAM maturase HydE [Bacteroidota bacterium]